MKAAEYETEPVERFVIVVREAGSLWAARRATATGRSPRHLVSAWATGSGLTLGQLQVAEKSN